MTINNPDGHLITLTQPNISDTDFEKLMKKLLKITRQESILLY